MHSIITSDRYIAVRDANGQLANYGTLRILTNEGTIYPAKWVAAHKRLESCGLGEAPIALPMYPKTEKNDRALKAAGISFAWLTEEEAESLTA
jgi:hypothetical protein